MRKESKNEVKVSEDVYIGKKHVFLHTIECRFHHTWILWCLEKVPNLKISKITVFPLCIKVKKLDIRLCPELQE